MVLGALLWLLALSLFVLPFLRASDQPDWGRPDPTRDAELDIPFQEDVASFDQVALEEDFGLEGTLGGLIAGSSERYFGLGSPWLEASGLIDVDRVEPGGLAYTRHCAGCHSLDGDGAGPAARYLSPRPRNFRHGVFKFTSTGTGQPPLRTDLFRTITRGLAGSSMPDHRLLPEVVRWDLVEYVRYLAIRGQFERMLLDVAWAEEELPDPAEAAEIVAERWSERNLQPVYPTASEPPRTMESVETGRELFLEPSRATCFTCHGEEGEGDGPTADEYEDAWGYPIRPRNFKEGVFRAGESGQELWASIATGIGGTPMGAFQGALSGEEIWHLVHYVQYLGGADFGQEGER